MHMFGRLFGLRQAVGVLIVTAVSIIGTLWYWLVEGFSPVAALYQSVITVSTVGFGEVEPLDTSGQIFTVVLILVGVSAVVYALGGFAEVMIESSVDRYVFRRKERALERMHDHTIICGYGRTGVAVARLLPSQERVGVVEADAERVNAAMGDGFVALHGDCTLDETLQAAGVERAARVIICLSSDSEAISTVLSAKVLNPDVQVVTRFSEAGSGRKLRLAGADHVVSPIEMGAQRLVRDAIEPSIGVFLDAALHDPAVGISILPVQVTTGFSGDELRRIEDDAGARVLGRQDADGSVLEAEGPPQAGQTLFVAGRRDELERFAAAVADAS